MQTHSTSLNASEILMREPERARIQRLTDTFLESKEITALDTRLGPLHENAHAFNSVIATAPSKLRTVAGDKEAIENMVRRFSKVKMTSSEIAKVLRARLQSARPVS